MMLGPTRSDGMGERPVDWPEIVAFANGTGRVSEPWELEALANMAQGYLSERQAGAEPLSVPPVERC